MFRLATSLKLLITTSTFLCFLYLLYTHHSGNLLDIHYQNKGKTKYILYWTGAKSFHLPNNDGFALFRNCKFQNCFVTEDKNFLPANEFAAIIFYIPTSMNHPKETLPEKRNPQQRYIFANFETPIRFFDSNAHYVFNNFYNWTMSYRFDSDVVRRHGGLVKKKTKYKMPSKQDISDRKGSVAWIVSNCNSVNNREELARKLAKHIKVDVFGKCGTMNCPDGQDCYDYVARNYKFYLSFENSYCKDYTTEKFFKALEKDIIPVVYGGGDYAAIAPKHSYINVEDFYSVEILASYLKILEQDLDSYLEYFEWKKDYVVERNGGMIAMCKLCEMLNDFEAPPKVYSDIKHWWFSDEMSGCKRNKLLPSIVFGED